MPRPTKGQRVEGSGRKKGTLNKQTVDVLEKLAALNCDPIQGMAEIAIEAKLSGDMALAGQMYKELAQYVAPKRKAIEHTGAEGGPIQQSISRIELVPIYPNDSTG
jgi:hypothetical protein